MIGGVLKAFKISSMSEGVFNYIGIDVSQMFFTAAEMSSLRSGTGMLLW